MDLGLTPWQTTLFRRCIFTMAPDAWNYVVWCEALGCPEDVAWLEKRRLIECVTEKSTYYNTFLLRSTHNPLMLHSFGGLPIRTAFYKVGTAYTLPNNYAHYSRKYNLFWKDYTTYMEERKWHRQCRRSFRKRPLPPRISPGPKSEMNLKKK